MLQGLTNMNLTPDVAALLNNTGMAQLLNNLRQTAVFQALSAALTPTAAQELTPLQKDRQLLHHVGPAAASAVVDMAISSCRQQGKLQTVHLNGDFVTNMKVIHNDAVEEYPNFSSVLRQFLLPRYAYLDFDHVIDPRHLIDLECGYPKFITPIMYRYMYDRDDVARRVTSLYSDECWATDPQVYESQDPETPTEFDTAYQDLCDSIGLKRFLYRIDRLCGVGHYGALLMGIDDGADLEKPIDEPELLMGKRRSVSTRQRQLLYLRPFDEYLSFIHQYETDVMHPRYGQPKFYNLVFLDMTIDAAGASIGTRLNRRVHWTRVVHVADNLESSLVFGVPRQQPVFNRELDLRKIKGADGEAYYKGAWPGLSFEIDPRFVEDDPDFDKDKFRREIDDYMNGLRRAITTLGVKVNSLAPAIADPTPHVMIQLQAIAAYLGCPMRILMGSEEGRLASSQDKITWNTRLKRKLRTFTEPGLIRNVIDRFIAIGIMPPPESGKYFVGWDDLNTVADEDKANLCLKETQALSQYVSTGLIHFIEPRDYMMEVMRWDPVDAIRLEEKIKNSGGWDKLKDVDPSQVNGTAENPITKGSKEGTSGERPPERDSSDKKIEGSE